MTDYPEHEKMHALRAELDAVGEFIDCLSGDEDEPYTGFVIARWERMTGCERSSWDLDLNYEPVWRCVNGTVQVSEHATERAVKKAKVTDGGVCPSCDGTGEVELRDPVLVRAGLTIEQHLARHFGIDQDKLNAEKDAMLAALRAEHAKAAS